NKKEKKIKCLNCAHYCLLKEGQAGICGVRKNLKGKLYSLNYGKIVALCLDPIEKKPFFHFLPGTFSLSFASVGCNFRCLNCQNYDISQEFKSFKEIPGKKMSPLQIIKLAKKENVPSISYTYTEPAIFSDFALEIMKRAKKEGIKNCWVSNGFWSKELFEKISPYLDAANIDLKGFSDQFYLKMCGARLNPVLETLKRLREKNIWLEITTLVIPGWNDKEEVFYEIANFIKKELADFVPWHISKFFPEVSWRLKDLPETPMKIIKRAWEIGREVGLKFVYTGNLPGLLSEDTFCPFCQTLLIDRFGYSIKRYDQNKRCPKCQKPLLIIE
ncbi:MAG: AmmeMemoRadiSam system radical SAM enzyme, partial [Minisyncoccales bacterium]